MSRNARQTLITLATAAIALLGAGAAMAQEATPDTWMTQAKSTKTRTQVTAELYAARADGSINAWRAGYIEPLRTHVARAEVKAETRRAIASGEAALINSETYGFNNVAPAAKRTTGQNVAAK
ncbi:MAG: DUF4148 domain-containing protein [Burkholderiaceae bacterium]|nr:DUF4148 domain-containing protein [Burkholderiaceae bacterium]